MRAWRLAFVRWSHGGSDERGIQYAFDSVPDVRAGNYGTTAWAGDEVGASLHQLPRVLLRRPRHVRDMGQHAG